jgi:hypothetical protein
MTSVTNVVRLFLSALLIGWVAVQAPTPVTLVLALLLIRAEIDGLLTWRLHKSHTDFQAAMAGYCEQNTRFAESSRQAIVTLCDVTTEAMQSESGDCETAEIGNAIWFIDGAQKDRRKH